VGQIENRRSVMERLPWCLFLPLEWNPLIHSQSDYSLLFHNKLRIPMDGIRHSNARRHKMRSLSESKISVIGLGYVGLPLAVEFGKKFDTLGFDINAQRIAELKAVIVAMIHKE
jgi:hypothetical protein